ncbi:MAG: hypothetical protein LBE30_16805 [Comamonas sp.]|jgi:hypothetical protein|nr:hypothetical protein [Comamonas sp.]
MASLIPLTRRTAALLLVASLAACGGGGGGSSDGGGGGGSTGGGGESGGGTGGGNGGGNGNGGSGGNGSQSVTGTYQLKAGAETHSQMLADANAMGANGYVLFSSLTGAMTATTRPDIGDFYLSDTAHAGRKFSYVNPASPGSMSDFLNQLNQQGSSGYMYKSGAAFPNEGNDFREIYVKDNSRNDQFTYRTVTPVATTAQTFSAELNAQGQAGYRYLGPQIINGVNFSLYAKRNDNVTYEYQVNSINSASPAADNAGLQKLLTEKGAGGWFMRGVEGLGDAPNFSFVDVYEKSSAQSGAIEYLVESSQIGIPLQTQLDSMNANAAKGFFFFSQYGTEDGKFSAISIKNSAWMIHPLAGVSFP